MTTLCNWLPTAVCYDLVVLEWNPLSAWAWLHVLVDAVPVAVVLFTFFETMFDARNE